MKRNLITSVLPRTSYQLAMVCSISLFSASVALAESRSQLVVDDQAWQQLMTQVNDNLSSDRFVLAARFDQKSLVKYMLQSGVDVNAKDTYGDTALIAAASAGRGELVAFLLQQGANVDAQNDAGLTALMNAAIKGYDSIVATLLDANAQVDIKTPGGETALFKAVGYGHKSISDALLAKGAALNIQNNFPLASPTSGYTPLMYAVKRGLVESDADWTAIVQSFLDHGADPNLRNHHGDSALTIAEANEFLEAAALLHEVGARYERRYASLTANQALLKASRVGDIGKVKQLLKSGADANSANKALVTPLLAASYTGSRQVVEALIAAGAKVDRQPEGLSEWLFRAQKAPLSEHVLIEAVQRGDTALITAARRGHTDIVAALLTAGANPNLANLKGESPLFAAAALGQAEIINLLVDKGVDPNQREKLTQVSSYDALDQVTDTALIKAVRGGHTDATQVLLENQADPNLADAFGLTPLMVAARSGNVKLTSQLIAAKADVNAVAESKSRLFDAFNVSGGTALIFAARGGHKQVVSLLLDAGANPEISDAYGKTAAGEATNNGYEEIAQLLN